MDFQAFLKGEQKSSPKDAKTRARTLLFRDMQDGHWATLEETPEELKVRFTFFTGIGGLEKSIEAILLREISRAIPSPRYQFQVKRVPQQDLFETRAIFLIQKSPPPGPSPPTRAPEGLEELLAGEGILLMKSLEKAGVPFFWAIKFLSDDEPGRQQVARINAWTREQGFDIGNNVFDPYFNTYQFEFYKSA